MPLTPANVHDITFKKPSLNRRGYDEEEVDSFLERIERELARLIEENKALRAQVEPGGAPADPEADPRLAGEVHELKAQLDRLRRDKAAVEQKVRAMKAELEQAAHQGGPAGGDGEPPLRVLMMARRTADHHVAEARREAEKLLSDARSTADRITGEAWAKADALEREARQRHQEAIRAVDANRTAALNRLEELRGFHREYRAQLRAHVESQLRDLEGPKQDLKAKAS
ncbi:DivIVA domain-containing protein [Actinomycetes bacterium KLBMP 9797]